jgi:hypothetical protein
MLLPEESDSSYSKIDFAFAVSMLGQVVNKNDLVRYLLELQEEFENMSSDLPETPKQDIEDSNNNNNTNNNE